MQKIIGTDLSCSPSGTAQKNEMVWMHKSRYTGQPVQTANISIIPILWAQPNHSHTEKFMESSENLQENEKKPLKSE